MAAQLTEADLVELASRIMSLLDAWKVEPAQRVTLLGLPADTRPRHLSRYREGAPFPHDQEVLTRAENFLSIHDALYTTFPHNQAMARMWITTPNRYFDNHTPLQIMLEGGMEGIRRVRRHLDCTENWF